MVLTRISLIISDVEHLFNMSIGHLYVLFGEASIQVLCPFFNLAPKQTKKQLIQLYFYFLKIEESVVLSLLILAICVCFFLLLLISLATGLCVLFFYF